MWSNEPVWRSLPKFLLESKPMNTKRILTFLLLGCALSCGSPLKAAPLQIELPVETPSFRQGEGVQLAMAQCLQCHSAEYITTQPPLGRPAWKASIEKMRGKYGATVPPETEAALLDYLAGAYGPPSVQSPRK
jgi:hypothetical protein